jgi:trehalose/maltose transport system substrate-binding protein
VWHAGNAAFMRNWPYAYVSSGESEDIPAFDVAPLPAGAAGIGAATLGGWHIGVSRYSENPEASAAFAAYMTSVENQKFYAIDTSSPPAALELYSDPDIQEAMPFASADIVEIATARPSTYAGAQYNAVSTLYFTAIHSILTGEEDADVALELLELDLMELLESDM